MNIANAMNTDEEIEAKNKKSVVKLLSILREEKYGYSTATNRDYTAPLHELDKLLVRF